jgi:hypothetical protein
MKAFLRFSVLITFVVLAASFFIVSGTHSSGAASGAGGCQAAAGFFGHLLRYSGRFVILVSLPGTLFIFFWVVPRLGFAYYKWRTGDPIALRFFEFEGTASAKSRDRQSEHALAGFVIGVSLVLIGWFVALLIPTTIASGFGCL